jgi:DNA mismatch repair ATPase MutS
MITGLIETVHLHVPVLYKCCESIALLDMLCSFAALAMARSYGKDASRLINKGPD